MKKIGLYQRIGVDIQPFLIDSVDADLYVRPEDFIVGEILDGRICTIEKEDSAQDKIFSQKYIHATLVKRNTSTIEACSTISEENNIDFDDITYCGLKDTLGLTAQRICILNKGKLKKTKFRKFFLKNFTGSDQKLKPRDNNGNHFRIRVRNIADKNRLEKRLNKLLGDKILLPNFYGPQRFGIRQNNHFLGKLLLEGKYYEFAVSFFNYY